ncbi:MAG: purine-nucleoside phosphorylase [Clostridia bacterium]|nr:purine-nucleoside phosphorylase [Clostridia bacterium]
MDFENYQRATNYIKSKIGNICPKLAIVLGSGLGVLADEFEDLITIKYKDIPDFPVSTVSGHAGELLIGNISGVPVIAMNGRFHYYEGYDLEEVTFPIRVFHLLGINDLLLTNASGGINLDFQTGDFMVINDQLSFFAESALRGKNLEEFGTRFPSMSQIYDMDFSQKLFDIINKYTNRAQTGVYAYMKGPSFETPSEIKALRVLGADAVGMSTVPEAIIAKHCGIRVVGVSCITNMAAGISSSLSIETNELSHEDVKETADKVKYVFKNIVKEYIQLFKS